MVLSDGRDQPAVARTDKGDRRIRAIGRAGFSDPTRPRSDAHTPSLDPYSSRIANAISAGAIVAQRPARLHSDSTRSSAGYLCQPASPATPDGLVSFLVSKSSSLPAAPIPMVGEPENPLVVIEPHDNGRRAATRIHSGQPQPNRIRERDRLIVDPPLPTSGRQSQAVRGPTIDSNPVGSNQIELPNRSGVMQCLR
jgi:hypothetical protein